jgi:hypothetical protein
VHLSTVSGVPESFNDNAAQAGENQTMNADDIRTLNAIIGMMMNRFCRKVKQPGIWAAP